MDITDADKERVKNLLENWSILSKAQNKTIKDQSDEIERLRELLQNWMGCCFVDEKNGSVSFGMGVKKVWAETRAVLQQQDNPQ